MYSASFSFIVSGRIRRSVSFNGNIRSMSALINRAVRLMRNSDSTIGTLYVYENDRYFGLVDIDIYSDGRCVFDVRPFSSVR